MSPMMDTSSSERKPAAWPRAGSKAARLAAQEEAIAQLTASRDRIARLRIKLAAEITARETLIAELASARPHDVDWYDAPGLLDRAAIRALGEIRTAAQLDALMRRVRERATPAKPNRGRRR